MTIAERLVETVRRLPEPLALELLDFAEYLERKHRIQTDGEYAEPSQQALSVGSEIAAGEQASQPKRRPSPKLAGTRILGDLLEPVLTTEEWEASFERTCRQIEGDPKAFE